jgi:hypothetical protein
MGNGFKAANRRASRHRRGVRRNWALAEVQAVTVDQPIKAMSLKEMERRADADRIRFHAAGPILRVVGIGEAGGDDRRQAVQRRMVANVLQRLQRLQIAE